jgi:hypothetical protein
MKRPPFDLFKKSFHLLEETLNLFGNLKRSKMEETAHYFEKGKTELRFSLPFQLLCHTLKL